MLRGALLFFAGFAAAFLVMGRYRQPEPDSAPYLGDASYYDGVLHGHVEPNDLN